MDHPNLEPLRQFYAALDAGDPDSLPDLLAEEVVWHVPGRSAVAGEYRGRGQIFGYPAKLDEASGGTGKLELHDVMANDNHGVALVHVSATRGGRTYHTVHVHVFPFPQGKVTDIWTSPTDLYADDEFWSS